MRWLAAALLALAACSPTVSVGDSGPPVLPRAPERVAFNAVAADFLPLIFGQEDGTARTVLLRFAGPVRVRLGPELGAYGRNLDDLLMRLRQEAGIDIRRATTGEGAEIAVRTAPGAAFRQMLPRVSCLALPADLNWPTVRALHGQRALPRWADLTQLESASVLISDDLPPHAVRACLHEEIAQALGVGNDLYRLSSSVFNDDNRFSALTGHDMAVLHRLYRPDLTPGLTRREVARIAGIEPRRPSEADRDWHRSFTRAADPRLARATRVEAGRRALELAQAMRPSDHRVAENLLRLAALLREERPALARRLYQAAYDDLARRYGRDHLRTAHAATALASYLLAAGEPAAARAYLGRALTAAAAQGEAALAARAASLLVDALATTGPAQAAATARLDSARWARYAFGPPR
ncbi:MAG: DUF2927 domain-containing protein [Pseudomonadota bacterium]